LSRGINPRGAIADFYCAPPRTWTFDSPASTLFRLQFYRGDWKTSRWLEPLAKTWLGKIVSVRRPLALSAESEQAALATRPAELTVHIVPEKNRVRVTLDYCIFFAGRKAEIPREERKRWKAIVDEDLNELERALATNRAES
jgi:hypothetical protein